MAAVYDSTNATFLDEKSVRDELTRVFDTCAGCRRCTGFCGSFDTLFDMLGVFGGGHDHDHDHDHDAGRLSPAQQDEIIDQCFQCDACVSICPFAPDLHERAIDMPKTLLRAVAMRSSSGQRSPRDRRAAAVVGRPDRVGRVGSRLPTIANVVVGAAPGSIRRRVLSVITGVTSSRRLPMFAEQRFSTWFRSRSGPSVGASDRRVAIYPTCLVEYGATQIGRDLVAVYEHSGIECVLSSAGCCGAGSLHAGDVDRFASLATDAVTALAREIREYGTVVVPQTTCASVLRRHAVDRVAASARPDAAFVAAHLADAATPLTANIDGVARTTIRLIGRTVAHHVQTDGAGEAAGEMLTVAGATVDVVRAATGITSTWGLRANADRVVSRENEQLADRLGGHSITVTGEDVVVNHAIADASGTMPVHPIGLMAQELGELPDHGR